MDKASKNSPQPIWMTRQEIGGYVLSPEETRRIIEGPPWRCVISWVTKDCQPVACAMAYIVLDGKIVLSSTRNRDKVRAFQRNPAISICFQGSGFKQVTVRGRVTLSSDPELVRRWTEAHVDSWGRTLSPQQREVEIARYLSPDRVLLIVEVEKMRTFNGELMMRAEAET